MSHFLIFVMKSMCTEVIANPLVVDYCSEKNVGYRGMSVGDSWLLLG